MNARFAIAGLVVAVCLVACSGTDPTSDSGVDAGPDGGLQDGGNTQPTDGGQDAGTPQTDGGQDAGPQSCSGFVTDAGEVAQMFVRGSTPVGTGGTIVDGVYDITSWSVYTGALGATGPTGVMVSATQVISAGVYQYNHLAREGDAGVVLDTNGTFATPDGGLLVGEQLCPPGAQPFTSYTTDGTNLVLYSVSPPWGLALRRR
jgi:hypothetical protein